MSVTAKATLEPRHTAIERPICFATAEAQRLGNLLHRVSLAVQHDDCQLWIFELLHGIFKIKLCVDPRRAIMDDVPVVQTHRPTMQTSQSANRLLAVAQQDRVNPSTELTLGATKIEMHAGDSLKLVSKPDDDFLFHIVDPLRR